MKTMIFLFFSFIALPSFTADCEKNGVCGKVKSVEELFSDKNRKTNTLDKARQTGILVKSEGISIIGNNLKAEKKESAEGNNIDKISPIPEIPDKKSEKKLFENPVFSLIWLIIFLFLYFYLKDKKRKRKKAL